MAEPAQRLRVEPGLVRQIIRGAGNPLSARGPGQLSGQFTERQANPETLLWTLALVLLSLIGRVESRTFLERIALDRENHVQTIPSGDGRTVLTTLPAGLVPQADACHLPANGKGALLMLE